MLHVILKGTGQSIESETLTELDRTDDESCPRQFISYLAQSPLLPLCRLTGVNSKSFDVGRVKLWFSHIDTVDKENGY